MNLTTTEALKLLRDAAQNLITVKGRHNSEIAYNRLVSAYDATASIEQDHIASVGNMVPISPRLHL